MSHDYTQEQPGAQVAPSVSGADGEWAQAQSGPLLLVISGPSGVGKDSIIARLRTMGEPFHFVVTATDHAPRPNEVDGSDYHFVSRAEFERMIRQGELLEWANVYGDYKGVPREQIRQALASGNDVILRVDVQGAATVKRLAPAAILIFIRTEHEADMVRRLEQRHTDTAEQMRQRIATARAELRCVGQFDYCVVNREGQIEAAARDILSILRAERLRVNRPPVAL